MGLAGLIDKMGNRESDSSGERPCAVTPLGEFGHFLHSLLRTAMCGTVGGWAALGLPKRGVWATISPGREEPAFQEVQYGENRSLPPAGSITAASGAGHYQVVCTPRTPPGDKPSGDETGPRGRRGAVWCRCWLWQRSCIRLHGSPNRA